MELSDPSGSIYGQMGGMEPRRLSVTPSSSGNVGRSVRNTLSRRRSRMSNPPSGTSLMPLFNAAAADGGGSEASSSRRLDLVLDEWRIRNIGIRSLPEAPPTAYQVARLLFLGSPMTSAAADDNVLIMDGVLVGNSGSIIASSTRRSFSDPGLVATDSPGSSGSSSCGSNGQVTDSSSSSGGSGCGSSTVLLASLLGSGDGGRFGSNGQFAQGREEARRMQAMRQTFSEVASQNSGRSSAGPPNMQGSPNAPHLFPPSLPGPAFPIAAPRAAVSSNTDTAITTSPPAFYFTPPAVTVTAARPSQPTPTQPETEPVQPPPAVTTTSFTWPPTAEEDAIIAQQLYGPTTRRRLPVFQAICPAE